MNDYDWHKLTHFKRCGQLYLDSGGEYAQCTLIAQWRHQESPGLCLYACNYHKEQIEQEEATA